MNHIHFSLMILLSIRPFIMFPEEIDWWNLFEKTYFFTNVNKMTLITTDENIRDKKTR